MTGPARDESTAVTPPTAHNDGEVGDHWVDTVTARRANTWRKAQHTFGAPWEWAKTTLSFFTTSPGAMTLVTVIITIGILAAGVSMAQSSDQRQRKLDVLITNAEPMSYNAHNIYTSLSIANTAATTGFVQAGVENQETRLRYNEAIRRAGESLAETAAGISTAQNARTDDRALELIIDIQHQLSVYVGLVETARTNNRAGNPVGAAYMAEASEMMRDSILPDASNLFVLTTGEVITQQNRLSTPQWIPISGLVAALIMLGLAQMWLAVKTRRRLNKGFVAATVFMSLSLIWVAGANYWTWKAGTEGFEEAAAPLNALTNARIRAEQAHSEETLAMVLRQGVESDSSGFDDMIRNLNRALDDFADSSLAESDAAAQHVKGAREAMNYWEKSHQELVNYLGQGKYQEALETAVGSPDGDQGMDDGTTASAFDALDDNVAALIADARVSLRAYIRDGLAASSAVPVVVLFLSLASVVSLWLGIRPRLQEYL